MATNPLPPSKASLVERKRRYCPMCDKFVPAKERECKTCGAETEKVPQ